MKKFFILLTIFTFACSVFAETPEKRIKNYPEGTFKKTKSGKIVQYDKNGKKVGIYKLNNRKYVRTK